MSDRSEPGAPGETARRLLAERGTCTLATATPDGTPEAATVRFVADDSLNLYVTTESNYRKYENLTRNPAVALVVDGERYNLQLEGTATEIAGEETEFVRERYRDKYGDSEYLSNPKSVFFEIDTDWARLLVDGGYPPRYEMVLGEGEETPLDGV
jgi:nitroimidazol reductase NimA-like FMN-containing flavoprotein (pyridoxamine 5'-phosphate oxidase superfamily)